MSRLRRVSIGSLIFGVVVALALVLTFGCALPEMAKTGSLRVTVGDNFGIKILEPPHYLPVDHFLVSADFETNHYEQVLPTEGGVVSWSSMPLGDYYVQVTAYNDLTEPLGFADGYVLVEPNVTSTLTLYVAPFTGDGSLVVDVTLTPPDVVASPEVQGELFDGAWSAITYDILGGGAYQVDEVLSAGFYFLKTQLWSMGVEPFRASGAVEAVIIAQDRITAGAYDFNVDNITPPDIGGVGITIINEFPQLIPLVFIGDPPDTASPLEDIALEVDAGEVLDSYAWYVDGEEVVGEVTPIITLNFSSEGFKNISALGVKGSVLCSAQKGIAIVEPYALVGNYVSEFSRAVWWKDEDPARFQVDFENADTIEGIWSIVDDDTIHMVIDRTYDDYNAEYGFGPGEPAWDNVINAHCNGEVQFDMDWIDLGDDGTKRYVDVFFLYIDPPFIMHLEAWL